MGSLDEMASPQERGHAQGAVRFSTIGQPEPRSILVLGGHFLSVDILVLALTHVHYSARCIAPVTPDRVHLALSDWPLALAVLDIDFVEPRICRESIILLREAKVPVVVLGGKKDSLADCVNFGATYAIDKALPVLKLIDVIDHMVRRYSINGSAANAQATPYMYDRSDPRERRPSPFDVLTHREKCVLAELMDGHCAEEIAVQDVVAISTVRSQIKAILQKLGVSSQLAATALARHAGWTFDERARFPGPS